MTGITDIAEIAMLNELARMSVHSQNLANVGTLGYKRDVAVNRAFASLLGEAARPVGTANIPPTLQSDVSPATSAVTDPSQGAIQRTDNPLDVAIEGKGFFEISTADGVRYTRRGRFSLDGGGRLVTSDGNVVNGISGEIRLHTANPRIDSQGTVWDGEDVMGHLKIVLFDEADRLEKSGPGNFSLGKAQPRNGSTYERVRQGFVETSNVSTQQEMVQIITTLRQFEMNQRIVRSYDDMMDTAISTLGDMRR